MISKINILIFASIFTILFQGCDGIDNTGSFESFEDFGEVLDPLHHG